MSTLRAVFKKYYFSILVIAALSFVAYSFMLSGDFKTIDDRTTILENTDIQSFAGIKAIFTQSFFGGRSYYRPLVSLSNMVNYVFWGPYPFAFNLTNLLLHILTALSVLVAVQILFRDRRLSFFTALLFAVHPIHWSAVANIAGRAIIMCALFYITAFSLFCISWKSRKKGGSYALSLACFVLALLSKEAAVVLPVVLAAYTLLSEKPSPGWNKIAAWTLPFFLIDGVYMLVRRALGITYVIFWQNTQDLFLGVMTFLRAVGTYLRLFIFPVDLYFDRAREYFHTPADPELIATLAVYAVAAFVLARLRRRFSPMFWFLAGWFWIALIPVSQVLPIIANVGYATTAEHFMYIPSLAVFVGMAAGGRWIAQKLTVKKAASIRTLQFATAGIYIFFMVLTIQYNIYSTNELAMFRRSLEFNPYNVRVNTSLGVAYGKIGLLGNSEQCFRKALESDPISVNARIGLGKVLFDEGRYLEGLAEYERVLAVWGMSPLLKNNLNKSYEFLIERYQAKIEKNPGDARAYYGLGVMYSKKKDIASAIGAYRRAVASDPQFKEALFNLAASYAALGRTQEAVESYLNLLAIAPASALHYQACLELSRLYAGSGDLKSSEIYKEKAAEFFPLKRENDESYIAEVGAE